MTTTEPHPTRRSTGRILTRWLLSFAGFPLGGLAALLLIGPVDSLASAIVGGLVTGAVLGLVQAWALRADRQSTATWAAATALGLAVGLAVGASLGGFATGLDDLLRQGAVSGAAVGLAQAVTLWPRFGPIVLAWPGWLTLTWMAGWSVSTAIGVDTDQQFTVFGSSGAVTVALLTSILPLLLSSPQVRTTTGSPSRPTRTTARLAAAGLALASALAIAGFTVLGTVFAYPQILHQPTGEILAQFRQHQLAVTSWFGVLMLSAALMAPVGVWLGRLAGGVLGQAITWFGIAAAVVQVAGLQRWLTLVPAISRDALDPGRSAAAEQRFELAHTILGRVIGETLGYAATATFTVLVVLGLRRTVLPRWLSLLGYASAALIATGVAVPLVAAASLTNFAGYVLWCGWLLAVAAVLAGGWRVRSHGSAEPAPTGRGRYARSGR